MSPEEVVAILNHVTLRNAFLHFSPYFITPDPAEDFSLPTENSDETFPSTVVKIYLSRACFASRSSCQSYKSVNPLPARSVNIGGNIIAFHFQRVAVAQPIPKKSHIKIYGKTEIIMSKSQEAYYAGDDP
jgi:hypothetical protein